MLLAGQADAQIFLKNLGENIKKEMKKEVKQKVEKGGSDIEGKIKEKVSFGG